LDRRLGGPQAGLDAVAKRKIPIPCRESSPALLACSRYIDLDIPDLDFNRNL